MNQTGRLSPILPISKCILTIAHQTNLSKQPPAFHPSFYLFTHLQIAKINSISKQPVMLQKNKLAHKSLPEFA
ncbi:hypothetical protein BpHYR1_032708 [Brachionus plicatilis]|uniref:Uncharacterized protein n=1 Tax=Brachionus plicatilis TaxID=10195 RepID=A0A3M7Q3C1_BRAPC|nr:hypothetical protein BpHYR1_032708 [Brachionus plicatilis]